MANDNQSDAKTSSPRRKQKFLKETAPIEMPAAPVKITAEQNPTERLQGVCSEEPVTQQQLEESANFLNKIKTLQHALEFDILACDAKWTLFVTAAYSYRYEDLLQPFPAQFATPKQAHDIDAVISVIINVPKLSIVLKALIGETYADLSGEVIELLHWVLVEKAEPNLRLVEDAEEFDAILKDIDDKPLKNKPTHVFKIIANEGFHSEELFKQRTQNFPRNLAFMTHKLDTLYASLQNGFSDSSSCCQLYTDLSTALKQSPCCAAWGASQCGSIISCTSICEFAFNAEKDQITANEKDRCRSNIRLTSPANLRLCYLIFYGRRLPRTPLPRGRLFSWTYNYKFTFSLLSYMLILLTIGLSNNGKGELIKMYVIQQYQYVVAFCQRFITKVAPNQ